LIDVVTTSDKPRSAPVPRGWVAGYLLGSLVVIGFVVGGLIATDHAVGQLADDIRAANVSSCAGSPQPQCRADYAGVLTDVFHGSDSTDVLIRTRFLATTDPNADCLDNECSDEVKVRTGDGKQLRRLQHVTISAGAGRVYMISVDGDSIRTFDNPSISVLNTASSLTWALWILAFGISWLTAYLFMTLGFRLWHVTSTTVRRGVNIVTLASLIGSLATFLAFAFGGAQALVVLAAGLLITAGAGALARHHPEFQQPVAEFVPDAHWRSAVNRSVLTACYVIFAIPLPLGIAVAFLLAHDNGGWVSPLLAALIGVALTVLIFWRVQRRKRARALR
jgi:hypothetical protein